MSSDADRQRLRRQRARHGLRVVAVEIGPDAEDGLVLAGLLHERDLEDREAIAAAVEKLIAILAADSRHT